jgi:hypothetical protein
MDFSTRDSRSVAERGFFYCLRDPFTDEKLLDDNGDEVGFMLRGAISPTAQKKLSALLDRARKRGDIKDYEQSHQSTIDAAMVYIIHGVNISFGGDDVADDEALIRKMLNTSFPQFKTTAGELEQLNTPYAVQIARAAEEYGDFLAEPPNGSS